MIRCAVLAGFLLVLALPVRADTYVEPDWPNLVRTMVRLNTLDIGDDALIDEYAIITECPLYEHFYTDDFKWNQVRAAVRQSIGIHNTEYPLAYGYPAKVRLDRYDFREKLFRFTESSAIHSVNALLLFQTDGIDCGRVRIKYIPKSFRALLTSPFTILGLPLEADVAQALLEKMKVEGNVTRTIYARFNLHITFADQLHRSLQQNSGSLTYAQTSRMPNDPFQMDAKLDSVDFFTDEDRTKLIYTFKP